MSDADDIRAEIALIEAWLRDGAITREDFEERKKRLDRLFELTCIAAEDRAVSGQQVAAFDTTTGAMQRPINGMQGKPTKMGIFVLLLSVLLIVLGSKLYSVYRNNTLGSVGWFNGRSFVELSVVEVRPAYNGCDVTIEFRNTGSTIVPSMSLSLTARNGKGAVVGSANGGVAHLAPSGATKSRFYFKDVGCLQIDAIRQAEIGGNANITVSSGSKLIILD